MSVKVTVKFHATKETDKAVMLKMTTAESFKAADHYYSHWVAKSMSGVELGDFGTADVTLYRDKHHNFIPALFVENFSVEGSYPPPDPQDKPQPSAKNKPKPKPKTKREPVDFDDDIPF